MLFIRPCKGRITSHFNLKRRHPIHNVIRPHWGIDFGSHADNTIVAAQSGTVRIASHSNTGFGNYVIITHSNGWETVYAHLRSIAVKVGQKVKRGQYIGVKGSTGDSTGVHLHFELSTGRWSNKYTHHVNPVGYIDDPSIPLHLGVTGPRVGDLQRALNRLGYNLKVDNSFGSATDKAVRDYQRRNKLAVDGSVGPATFSKLNTARLAVDGYLGPDTIKELQRYFGTTVDGVISKPSQVVKKLQALLGVKQDGLMGPITIKALQKRLGTPQDGRISKPSLMVKELQKRLNSGKL